MLTPRPYQREALAGIAKEFQNAPATLVVMATGTGKTVVFGHEANRHVQQGGRVLVSAHRHELVAQAAEKIERITGIVPAIEMGSKREASSLGSHAIGGAAPQIVCTSVQSMVGRLDSFAPDEFALYIRDEAHRAVTDTDKQILEHFHHRGGALHLGVTATPKRADKVAMGKVYPSVAYEFDIGDAIPEGWLVPVEQIRVETSIDISAVKTRQGDLAAGELGQVMTERASLMEVAIPTLDTAGDRQSLTFCVTVEHAQLMAETMRENTSARVEMLHGGSPKDERRAVVEAYHRGEVQHLVNVGLFTEGFDAPPCSVIAMARPTKSELFYRQCIGRGTRPLDGVVDPFAEGTAEQRVAAILASAKPKMTVLDFVGNSGKHNLCSAVDLLGGVATDPEKAIAAGILEREDTQDVLEAFRLAKQRIRESELQRMRDMIRQNAHRMMVNPFMALDVSGDPDPYEREITAKQVAVLEFDRIATKGLDRVQASRLISQIMSRKGEGLCTYRQADVLIKRGLEPSKVWKLPKDTASGLIDALALNRWKPPKGWGAGLLVEGLTL